MIFNNIDSITGKATIVGTQMLGTILRKTTNQTNDTFSSNKF